MPLDHFKGHWQMLRIYRAGKLITGLEREKALRAWNRGEDPSLYVFPSYKQHEVDWQDFPHAPRQDSSDSSEEKPV